MKQEILRILSFNKGNFVSGEEISEKLKVSRTAIWKHINALREDGYIIESQTRLGYRLVKKPDLLLPEEIRLNLKSRIIGSEVKYYSKIDSTNTEAKKLAQMGGKEGTVVIAEEQTGGRGRRGRAWNAPFGMGIWVSVILRPQISPVGASSLTLVAAVASAKAVRNVTGLPVKIKWPNDLMLNSKKVGGILTELSAEIEVVNFIVVGIGINVNNESFPEELREIATSLKIEQAGKEKLDRVQLLCELLHRFEEGYSAFIAGRQKEILKQWKGLSDTLGNIVRVIGPSSIIEGRAVDLDETGALLVEKEDGSVERIISGDVSLRSIPSKDV
ncbi:MAG: biotin--[acetyl-CoA-carboxylase] ligase [Firmicutes bacterium]|nr:biotin--[acetyl-CoA-carboxylase] ligase [Bacillota bacterium]